jgi:phospholipid-binding lipoprotein MlaA
MSINDNAARAPGHCSREPRSSDRRPRRILAPILCVIVLAFPAAAFATPSANAADPFEPMNRAFFGVHQMVDHYVIRPAAMAYTRLMPSVLRKGLAHMAQNLGEPAVFVNDVLQGRSTAAVKTLTRFTGNTTFGVLGFFDVATPAGLPHHPNDFGMTLARYGVAPGPYIFIPLAGPTTVRDAIGAAANLALNPLVFARYVGDDAIGGTQVVSNGLETRAEADSQLKALFASATDPYASFRSYYLQARQAEIFDGRIDIESLPDFGPSDAGAAATPAAPTTSATASTPIAAETPASNPVADPAQAPAATLSPDPVATAASTAPAVGRVPLPGVDATVTASSAAESPAPPPTTSGPPAVVAASTQATTLIVTPVSLAHP